MSETTRDQVTAAVQEWMNALDRGDVEGMVATCDDRLLVANQGRATVRGPQTVREKYTPVVAKFDTESRYDIDEIVDLGDVAIVSGTFSTKLVPGDGTEPREPTGRLVLAYVRNDAGTWKLVLDVDNNAAP